MNNWDTIAMHCHSFLLNYQHASRKEQTERALERLRESLMREPSPTLGIRVSDGIATRDKMGG